MTVLVTALVGLLGLVIGSFLNVCIDRLPARKSLVRPPSHCDACGHNLGPLDLIPLVSYLALRGRCRYCGARIPARVPVIEASTGLMLAFLWWFFRTQPAYVFWLTAFYFCVLLVLSVIDLYHKLILNVIVYPVSLIVFAIDIFYPQVGIKNALIGGGIGLGVLLLPALLTRRGMGWGDVKLAGLIGLMTGFPNVIAGLMVGIILGGIFAIVLLLTRRKGRKDAIPFGPFLSTGAFLTLLWSRQMIDWYLHLLGR